MHTTTEGTLQHGGLVRRRFRPQPSEPSGHAAPLESESSTVRALASLLAVPLFVRPEPYRSGLRREVDEIFAEAQRMPRARR